MKRMNLKKAISLLSFLMVMFFSFNVSAQATVIIKAELTELNAEAPQSVADGTAKALKEALLLTIYNAVLEGETVEAAMHTTFTTIEAKPGFTSRAAFYFPIKQEIVALF